MDDMNRPPYSRRNEPDPPRAVVSCEFNGKTLYGVYWIAGKILTVATGKGDKSRQVGDMETEALAKQLLTDLAKAGKV